MTTIQVPIHRVLPRQLGEGRESASSPVVGQQIRGAPRLVRHLVDGGDSIDGNLDDSQSVAHLTQEIVHPRQRHGGGIVLGPIQR